MASRKARKPRPTGWRRARRWIVRSSGALLAAALLLLVGLTILFANLDRPAVSDPLADYLHESLGLEVSYETLRASMLSSLVGRNIRVASPVSVREHAPDFVRIGSIDASWAPGTLLTDHFTVHAVEIHELGVVLVVDEQGRTTLDLLFPPGAEAATPTPATVPSDKPFILSDSLGLLPAFVDLEKLSVDGIQVTVLELEAGRVRRATTVKGLGLEAALTPGNDGPVGMVRLYSDPETGLSIAIDEAGGDSRDSRGWQGRLDFRTDLNGNTLAVALSILLDHQSLVDLPVPPGEVVRLEGVLRFQPDARATQVEVTRLDLIGKAIAATLGATVEDLEGGMFGIHVAEGRITASLDDLLPLVTLPGGLEVGGGNVALTLDDLALDPATFYATSGRIAVSGDLSGVSWFDAPASVEIDAVSVRAEAVVRGILEQDVTLDVPLAGVVIDDGSTRTTLPRAALSVAVLGSRVEIEQPLASTGDVRVRLETRGGGAHLGATRVSDATMGLELSSRLSGTQPYSFDARLSVDAMTVADPAVGTHDLAGAAVEAHLRDVRVDLDDPSSASGRAVCSLRLGPLALAADVSHDRDATRWRVQADAPTLKPLGPLLNTLLSPGERVEWARMGVQLTSEGTARGVMGAGPIRISQQATVSARHLNYRAPDYAATVSAISGRFGYRGTPERGTLDADLKLGGWAYDVLWADRATEASLGVTFSLPEDRYRLRVRRFRGDVNYLDGDMKVAMRDLSGTADIIYDRGRLNGSAELETERIDYTDGADHVWLDKVSHHLRLASTEDIEAGVLEVAYRAGAALVGQNLAAVYPPVDMNVDLRLRLARLSAYSLDRCILESRQGGTRLEVALAMDDARGNLAALAVPGRGEPGASGPGEAPGQGFLASAPITGGESLTLSGVLRQDLGALTGDPGFLSARGEVVVPFRLESPEQIQYRLSSSLELRDVDLRLPGEELEIQGFTGKCLVVEEFRDGPSGFVLVPGGRSNAYARAAFPDTQPYLTGDSFFSIERLAWSDLFEAAPVAGNFRVDRNMVRLDQLQMGVAQGTVSGQLLVDYQENDTSVLFRGAANGLRLADDSSERFDANLALDFSLDKLDLNGRAHIVHIGRKTLLAMLDGVDPYHEDVDINQLRLALNAGYPRFVRVDFDHGFMSIKVDLGGLARTVRIDEIRGIPIGPILNTYLGDLL